jgi:uncharacterized coiled-coil protein SlyX
MATTDDVYNLVKRLSDRIEGLEKKVSLQATEISKLTAQLRTAQLRGEKV